MSKIKRVVGINILAESPDKRAHWKGKPHEFIRHYRFQDQMNDRQSPNYLEGMELIQYSIMNAPKNMENRDLQDWVTFYQKAHLMSDKDVKTEIKTREVLEAFEMTRLNNLPSDIQKSYADIAEQFAMYSDYTDDLVEEASRKAGERAMERGKEREHQLIAGMIIKGLTDEVICDIVGISKDELDKFKQSIH